MKSPTTNRRGAPVGLLLVGVSLALAACAAASGAGRLPPGETLYRLAVGGPEIGSATLLRLYAWHALGLSLPLLLLLVWHGFRVRRDGGISSPIRPPGEPAPPRVDRATFIRGEVLTILLTVAALIVLSVFVDAPVGPAARPGALAGDSKAPWIFLWVQELLRIWPPAVAGVLTPLAVLLIIALLPYFDWTNEGIAVWFNRQGRAAQVATVALFLAILALTVRAALR